MPLLPMSSFGFLFTAEKAPASFPTGGWAIYLPLMEHHHVVQDLGSTRTVVRKLPGV
jgi:hypothetical protein